MRRERIVCGDVMVKNLRGKVRVRDENGMAGMTELEVSAAK